jgi:polyisoprenoid-binding protein YceI
MKNTSRITFVFSFLLLTAFTSKDFKKESSLQIDPKASKLTWTGKKFSGEHTGTIDISNGTLVVADGKLKGGTFDINTKTITVTDLTDAAENAKLLGHLKNDDFFGVEKYPKATFVIASATHKGGSNYDIKGKLTLKSKVDELSFPATVNVEKDKTVAKASITVDRTKYGIKYGSKTFIEGLGDKFIYDEFVLDVTLVANGTAATAKSK